MELAEQFRWWRKGDLDGFFGLFVDNLIQLILIVVLCGAILHMPGEMVYGRILPGVAAAISATGLMHGYSIANGAIANAYGPSHTWPFVIGYSGIAAVFFVLGSREKGIE